MWCISALRQFWRKYISRLYIFFKKTSFWIGTQSVIDSLWENLNQFNFLSESNRVNNDMIYLSSVSSLQHRKKIMLQHLRKNYFLNWILEIVMLILALSWRNTSEGEIGRYCCKFMSQPLEIGYTQCCAFVNWKKALHMSNKNLHWDNAGWRKCLN